MGQDDLQSDRHDNLRKRLEALNGGPLRNQIRKTPFPGGAAARRGRARQDIGRTHEPGPPSQLTSGERLETDPERAVLPSFSAVKPAPNPSLFGLSLLENAAPGTAHFAGGGECWLIEQSVEQAAPWAHAAFLRVQAGWSDGLGRRAARRAGCRLGGLHHLLFVDLETTGLGQCPLFLIGTLQWDDGRFVIRQYFARRPSEERHALAAYAQLAAAFPALVTYNGESFDEPFLRQRAAVHNVALPPARGHLDLIKPARLYFRNSLPDCRLQTLEQGLCGRGRTGDIPGREIPAAYAAFVRSGDAFQIAAILEHNRLDLLTMLDLLDRIPLA